MVTTLASLRGQRFCPEAVVYLVVTVEAWEPV
jgi:hypothetical protein